MSDESACNRRLLDNADDERELIARLAPLRRSTVTDDFDAALDILDEYLPVDRVEIPSGTECWTWIIPQKWTLRSAQIRDGKSVILDASEHPLAVAPYSQPFEGIVSRDELIRHLRWSEAWPDSFVYEYRYAYNFAMRDWCLSLPYERVKALTADRYHVAIDAEFSAGKMKVGYALLPGRRDEIILIVSHLCHPGQANDGASGTAGSVRLYQNLARRQDRNFTYLFLFPPETIGTVGFLWAQPEIAARIHTGIVLEMLGVDNALCLKTSHQETSYIDRIAQHVFRDALVAGRVKQGRFREMYGNDELVLADPDFDVPMISLQHHPFPQYHTSRDNISSVHPERLDEAHHAALAVLDILEADYVPRRRFKGPIYLSRFELYVDSQLDRVLNRQIWNVMQRVGTGRSVFQIANELDIDFWQLHAFLARWRDKGLIDYEDTCSRIINGTSDDRKGRSTKRHCE